MVNVYLICYKGASPTKWGKDSPYNKQFSNNQIRMRKKIMQKKVNVNPYLIAYVEFSLKWTIDLNVNAQERQVSLTKNIRENLLVLVVSKGILGFRKHKYRRKTNHTS